MVQKLNGLNKCHYLIYFLYSNNNLSIVVLTQNNLCKIIPHTNNKISVIAKSMEKYLGNVKYIYTEVNTEEVYKECDTIDAIDKYLLQFGFERCDARIYKQFGWGDAFYIKK